MQCTVPCHYFVDSVYAKITFIKLSDLDDNLLIQEALDSSSTTDIVTN